jgi:hypothetical protein
MERYTEDMQPPTTPASLEAMAKTLDEIRNDVKAAVRVSTEARDFARRSNDNMKLLAAAAVVPTLVRIGILFAGSVAGGAIMSAILH